MIPDAHPVLLTSLEAGASARLHTTRLDDDTRSLLRSLGLTDASRLRVCKSGEPLIIQVRATRIGLSSSVAGGIYVVLDGEPCNVVLDGEPCNVVLDGEPRHTRHHARHRADR
ncbi:MAG TPA: FeoA family protein [Vicinamibacterales bacterium]